MAYFGKEGSHMSVEVKNLTFSYGQHKVLNNTGLIANDGELLAVLGANGSGKSTLFNCMLGLLKPSSGQVLIDGVPIREMSAMELARRVAYVPQSHSPSFSYSVFDMVLMGTTPQVRGAGVPGRREALQTDGALEMLGIADLRSRAYTEISGGERQLTLIARAIAQQARVLITDEPTANLDYGNSLRILKKIKELAREGYTVIQSTHNPDHAFLFADRVAALSDGHIIADGEPAATITPELVTHLYGVRVTVEAAANGSRTCVPAMQ